MRRNTPAGAQAPETRKREVFERIPLKDGSEWWRPAGSKQRFPRYSAGYLLHLEECGVSVVRVDPSARIGRQDAL